MLVRLLILLMAFSLVFSSCEKKPSDKDSSKNDSSETESSKEEQEDKTPSFQVQTPTVYVSGIELIGENIKTSNDGRKYVLIRLNENGYAEYQIEWRVLPDNATNTKVCFSLDSEKSFCSVDDNGLVKFTGMGAVTVTLTPADGTVLDNPVELMVVAAPNE